MPSATPRPALAIRPHPRREADPEPPPRKLKHRPCTSLPESDGFSQAVQHPYTIYERPTKRPMPSPSQTIAVANASGRQAASFIRVAAAVGYKVRAQLRNLDGIVASEISSLPNVTVIVGDLYTKPTDSSISPPLGARGEHPNTGVNHDLIAKLFCGAQLAFINTTFWGDEVAIGRALADAAVETNIQHYIFSSMPNHSLHTPSSDAMQCRPKNPMSKKQRHFPEFLYHLNEMHQLVFRVCRSYVYWMLARNSSIMLLPSSCRHFCMAPNILFKTKNVLL